MKMSNKAYDIAKYVLFTVVPASIALIEGLGIAYNFDTKLIIITISLFAAFFGKLLKISSDNYAKNEKSKTKKSKK